MHHSRKQDLGKEGTEICPAHISAFLSPQVSHHGLAQGDVQVMVSDHKAKSTGCLSKAFPEHSMTLHVIPHMQSGKKDRPGRVYFTSSR